MPLKLLRLIILTTTLPVLANNTVSCSDLETAVIPLPKNEAMKIDSITILSAQELGGIGEVPLYCEVTGKIDIDPEDDSYITFQLRLPEESSWNGRFLKIGNGSGGGQLTYYSSFEQPLNFLETTALKPTILGYANAVTDLGNQAFGALTWATPPIGEEELNYSHRAVHYTTVVSKSLIKLFYGKEADYSYFSGCSAGGQSALRTAVFYPKDFDGIIAAEAYLRENGLNFKWIQIEQLNNPIGQPQHVGRATLEAAYLLALDKCDGADGMIDGQVREGYRCDWDPTLDLAPLNLTPEQLAVFQAIYSPLIVDGKIVSAGFPPGSERGIAFWFADDPLGPLIFGANHLTADISWWQVVIYNDPSIGLTDISLESAPKITKENSFWDIKPQFNPFLSQGGKLIQIANYESGVTPNANQYEVANKIQRMRPEQVENYRFYSVPNSMHCGVPQNYLNLVLDTGYTSHFDPLSYLVDWVENGVPLEIVDALVDASQTPAKICPYPDRLVDHGDGNYSCEAQPRINLLGEEIIQDH